MGRAESISSPDHETLGLLKPPEDQSVVAAQKPRPPSAEEIDANQSVVAAQKPRLSYAEEKIGAIFQKIDENRDGLISKQELHAVHHEFHAKGDGRLPAQEPGGRLPQGVGAVGTGVAGSQLQNAESNLETMVAEVGDAAEDGNAAAVGGDSFDGAGVKDNGDGAATAIVGGDSFDGAGVKDNGDGAATAIVSPCYSLSDMEGAVVSGSEDVELTLLPRSHQTSDTPVNGNEAGGKIQQQQHSIDIVIENGGSCSSTENHGGGSGRCGNIGGGRVSTRVLTWLRRKFYAIWLLLGIREMNVLKTGSFALSLVTYFVDKQLSHDDQIYLKVALWCGVLAFFIAPMSVPGVNSALLARTRQAIARLTLIIGVLISIVTAVDEEKFRWLVLSFFAIFFLFCLCVEEDGGGGGA